MLVLAFSLLGIVGSTATAVAAQTPHPTAITLYANQVDQTIRFNGILYSLESNGWKTPINVNEPIIIQQEENGQWKDVKKCWLHVDKGPWPDLPTFSGSVTAPAKPGAYHYRAVFDGNEKWAPSMSKEQTVTVKKTR